MINIHTLIGIAHQAGQHALRSYGSTTNEYKRDDFSSHSIVTKIDRENDAFIREQLQQAYPTYNYVGEETGIARNGSDYTFYVDPIDGTMNYAHGMPEWCVSIGLAKGRVPIAGVMYFPVLGQMYHAAVESGAYKNGVKIQVSNTPLYKGTAFMRRNKAFKNTVAGIKETGSCCAALRYIATGVGVASMVKAYPWDICAGAVLVREAGGIITNKRGEAWELSDDYAVISNNAEHEKWLEAALDTEIRA